MKKKESKKEEAPYKLPETSVDMTIQVKAQHAKSLLDNPLWCNMFKSLKEKAIARWQNSRFDDRDKRDYEYIYLKVLDDVEKEIVRYISDAEIEEYQKEVR